VALDAAGADILICGWLAGAVSLRPLPGSQSGAVRHVTASAIPTNQVVVLYNRL
jgi:hypothetical protein